MFAKLVYTSVDPGIDLSWSQLTGLEYTIARSWRRSDWARLALSSESCVPKAPVLELPRGPDHFSDIVLLAVNDSILIDVDMLALSGMRLVDPWGLMPAAEGVIRLGRSP